MRRFGVLVVLVLSLGLLGTPVSASSPSGLPAPSAAPSDFNGDGRSDLAIASIVNPGSAPGSVNVLYGSASGLGAAGAQLWSFSSPGVPGKAQNGDFFGIAMASGDFNGDHMTDLAIGAYGTRIPPRLGGTGFQDGAVVILFGSAAGLTSTGSQYWSLATSGVLGSPATNSGFGAVLAAGDFNSDGRDDLAVASGTESSKSAVNVLYGSVNGLTSAGNQRWTRNSAGILGTNGNGSGFGQSLAAADFNGDFRDDLAIGVTYDTSTGVESAGGVNVIYGSPTGLNATGNQLWTQNSPGIAGVAEQDDFFGAEVAAGDFNGDDIADLAIGDGYEDIAGASGCCQGAVNVIYGSPSGLTSAGNQLWDADSPGVPGTADDNQGFGVALAAGDFTHDGKDELAIGTFRDVTTHGHATGSVTVLKGSAAGLTASGSSFWTQDHAGVPGVAEDGDMFGAALTTGDYKGSGRIDALVVGVPHESYGGTHFAGAVNVIYSNGTALTGTGSQLWDRATPGVPGAPKATGVFGWTVR